MISPVGTRPTDVGQKRLEETRPIEKRQEATTPSKLEPSKLDADKPDGAKADVPQSDAAKAWAQADNPMTNTFDAKPAVYRPGTDDASVTEVARRGGGHRNVAGHRLSIPATPGQAAQIQILSSTNSALRRQIEQVNPNYARSFLSSGSPQTPQNTIQGLRTVQNTYRRDLQSLQSGRRIDARNFNGQGSTPLPTHLKTASRRIDGLSRKPGDSSIKGQFTYGETLALAQRFVGQGFTMSRRPGEPIIMRSANQEREVRLPTYKSGVHSKSLQPFSSTGYRANFQQFSGPLGSHGRHRLSNVHVDVIPLSYQ